MHVGKQLGHQYISSKVCLSDLSATQRHHIVCLDATSSGAAYGGAPMALHRTPLAVTVAGGSGVIANK